MDKFLGDVSTAYWWLGVVVVGLLIKIISAYLKDPLDKLERVHVRTVASTQRQSVAAACADGRRAEGAPRDASRRAVEGRLIPPEGDHIVLPYRSAAADAAPPRLASYSHQDTAPFHRMDIVMGAFCLVTAIMAVISMLLGTSFYSHANEIEACLFEAGAGG